jgi:hypothetical protein
VLVEKLPDEIVQEFRREMWLRSEERRLLRQERELEMRTIFVGGTRILGFVRQGEEAVLWDLRKTERKQTPQTRRLIAQKLPPVRVRTVEVRCIIVAKPNQEEVVLTFPPRRQSGVALTPDMLRKSPDTVMIRVHHRDGMEECEVGVEDWREIVKSIPSFCRRCLQKVEVSVDGQRWFDAYEITKS